MSTTETPTSGSLGRMVRPLCVGFAALHALLRLVCALMLIGGGSAMLGEPEWQWRGLACLGAGAVLIPLSWRTWCIARRCRRGETWKMFCPGVTNCAAKSQRRHEHQT